MFHSPNENLHMRVLRSGNAQQTITLGNEQLTSSNDLQDSNVNNSLIALTEDEIQTFSNDQRNMAVPQASVSTAQPQEANHTEYVVSRMTEILQMHQQTASGNLPVDRLCELLNILKPNSSNQQPSAQNIANVIQPVTFNPPVLPNVLQQQNCSVHPPIRSTPVLQTLQPIMNPFEQYPSIHAVSTKMQPPPMNRECIDLWFLQLDAWFKNNAVRSDNQQFQILTTLMDSQLLAHVYDAVINPPTQGKYENLRCALQTALADSKFKKYQKLLNGGELGDQRPSHRLNELRRLTNDGLALDDGLLKHIWLNHLPSEAQAILAVSVDQSLDSLARLADGVVESLSARQIAAVNLKQPNVEEPAYIAEIKKSIEKLNSEIKSIRSRSKSRTRSKSKGRSDTSDKDKNHYTHCWYHHKFGDSSRKCQPYCTRYDEFQNKSKN